MASKDLPRRVPDEAGGRSINGVQEQKVVTSVAEVPVTMERKPFMQDDHNVTVSHTGS